MKYLIAKKLEMSQRYRPDGSVVPVTIVKVEPCVVTQIKNVEKDGYVAVQVGCGTSRHLSKPELGQRGEQGNLAILREFRVEKTDGLSVGAKADASVFAPGDQVQVTGVSKGKGFQGVVKRHHFRGGPASHGHKDNLRMPGSIGAGGHQHVHLGQKMGGRMGGEQVTVLGLEIIEVMADKGLLAIKGAVPGARNTELWITGPGEMTWTMKESAKAEEAKAEEAPVTEEAPKEEAPAEAAA